LNTTLVRLRRFRPILQNREKSLLVLAAILATAFVVYCHSLSGHFTNWDDRDLVAGNPAIRSLAPGHVLQLFTTPNREAYLPVRLLSYALDYSVWGIKPFGYHFGNILLHALNAFLIYLLLLRLFAAPKPALLAAFFFLVHPMQVESVAWISGRKEVLCGFFLLLSALCFHEHLTRDLVPREQVRKTTALIPYLLSLIFFILACLSKASAIVLPLLLVAIWLFAARPAERPRSESLQAFARWVAPFFVLAALVFALNLYVAWSHDVVKPYHGGGPMTTFLTMAYVLKNYILGLAFPANLSAKYFVPLVPSPFTG
jgi:hypothetical protein